MSVQRTHDARGTQKPLEERPWYKSIKAVAGLIVAITGAIAAIIAFIPKTSASLYNTVYAIDSSERAWKQIQPNARAQFVKDAIVSALATSADADSLAALTFGGQCDAGTKVHESLGTNRKDSIVSAFAAMEFSGKRTLVRAITDATAQYNDTARFPKEARKRIVVLTSGLDECFTADEAVKHIKLRLQDTGISAEIIVVGFDVPASDQEKLSILVASFGGELRLTNKAGEVKSLLAPNSTGKGVPKPASEPLPSTAIGPTAADASSSSTDTSSPQKEAQVKSNTFSQSQVVDGALSDVRIYVDRRFGDDYKIINRLISAAAGNRKIIWSVGEIGDFAQPPPNSIIIVAGPFYRAHFADLVESRSDWFVPFFISSLPPQSGLTSVSQIKSAQPVEIALPNYLNKDSAARILGAQHKYMEYEVGSAWRGIFTSQRIGICQRLVEPVHQKNKI